MTVAYLVLTGGPIHAEVIKFNCIPNDYFVPRLLDPDTGESTFLRTYRVAEMHATIAASTRFDCEHYIHCEDIYYQRLDGRTLTNVACYIYRGRHTSSL